MGHQKNTGASQRDLHKHSQGWLVHQSNSDDGSVNEIRICEFILIQMKE